MKQRNTQPRPRRAPPHAARLGDTLGPAAILHATRIAFHAFLSLSTLFLFVYYFLSVRAHCIIFSSFFPEVSTEVTRGGVRDAVT